MRSSPQVLQAPPQVPRQALPSKAAASIADSSAESIAEGATASAAACNRRAGRRRINCPARCIKNRWKQAKSTSTNLR
eukprot:10812340-Alexandrium_andersonii.AAC.1